MSQSVLNKSTALAASVATIGRQQMLSKDKIGFTTTPPLNPARVLSFAMVDHISSFALWRAPAACAEQDAPIISF